MTRLEAVVWTMLLVGVATLMIVGTESDPPVLIVVLGFGCILTAVGLMAYDAISEIRRDHRHR